MKKQTSEILSGLRKLELSFDELSGKRLTTETESSRHFNIVDLWNIHRQHRVAMGRRKFLT